MKFNPIFGNPGQRSANFYFYKRPDSKFSRLVGYTICLATAGLCHGSIREPETVHKWMGKTSFQQNLFIKTGGGLDLARGPSSVNP